jgi:mono/diheme cytochrome c family protein
MKRIRALAWSIGVIGFASINSSGNAQEAGNSARGLALAQQICSECHAVTKADARSANPASPRFETVANVPGMTRTALSAILQTSHRTMPNIILDADQMNDIIAYLLSLKTN